MWVQIGDALWVDGATTHGSEYRGYRSLSLMGRFQQAPVRLDLETSPTHADHPAFVESESRIHFQANAIESTTPAPGGVHILLRHEKSAYVTFHVANPLSPHGAGFWFKLRLLRSGDLYYLVSNPNKQGLIYYRLSTKWKSKLVSSASKKKRTYARVGRWIQELEDFELKLTRAEASRAAAGCALLDGLLVQTDGYDQKLAVFGVGAVRAAKEANGIIDRLVTSVYLPALKDETTARVSQAALLPLDATRVPASVFRTRLPVDLRCTGMRAQRDRWGLDWNGIPTDDARIRSRGVSFRRLWRWWTRHYSLGLRSLNSRAFLGFVPTDVRPKSSAARPWKLRFVVEFANETWRVGLAHVLLDRDTSVELELGSAPDVDGDPLELDGRLTPTDTPRPDLASVERLPQSDVDLVSFNLEPSETRNEARIVVGGVRLDLIGLRTSENAVCMAWRPGVGLGHSPVDLRVRLDLDALRPVAVTEDPEPGFALDGKWLGDRERPLVLDLSETSYRTLVEIEEEASAKASRRLDVRLRAKEPATHLETDVVVLDPSPMRVVRVKADSKARAGKDGLVAAFRDHADAPMSWEFTTATGRMQLTLPPQVIGEEMIKASMKLEVDDGVFEPVPFTDRLFDFRLSVPAQLLVDRTQIETARAPAPWNLRRILGRREGQVGVRLEQAVFELLYGMTTTVPESEGLWIADREARLGRIPFPADLERRFDEGEDLPRKLAAWIRGLLYSPAQLDTFRDWSRRQRVRIEDAVAFDLRRTRQTSDPLELERLHPDADLDGDEMKRDRERWPLRGGVDYGFESRKIYDAVRQNSKVDRQDRPQGFVSDLSFGVLGGTGSQQALFDEGRTLIISQTTQGRLDNLTIVRVGRISMLWNHARHVIVYERTTRTVPRYRTEQPQEFEGLAALRKVREYIEITQPARGYPDGAGSVRRSALLIGSFFESTMIPVHSSWGMDVKEGFLLPLAGPLPLGVDPSHYPTPNVFLELARAAGKGGKISQRVDTPERLAFFTSTRPGEGSDPDDWASRPDIDFPVTQRPRPPRVRYLPAFQGSKQQPDAQSYDYGQERFTLDLSPADEAADLMHGRPGDGLEACVRNVCLARGRPEMSAPANTIETVLGTRFSETEAQLGDALREVALHARRLVESNGDQLVSEIAGLRQTAADLVESALRQAEDLRELVKKEKVRLPKAATRWVELQKQRAEDSLRAWKEHTRRVLEKELDAVLDDIVAKLLGSLSDEFREEAQTRMRTALDVARTQSLEMLQRAVFIPERALDRLTAAIAGIERDLLRRIGEAERAWHGLLDDLERRYETEAPANLEAELRAAIEQTNLEFAASVANAGREIKDELGPLFADLVGGTDGSAGPSRRILDAIERVHGEYAEWIEIITSEVIPPFELGAPDWPLLRRVLSPTFLEERVVEAVKDLRKELSARLREALEDWRALLEVRLEKIDELVRLAKRDLSELIRDAADVQTIRQDGQALLKTLRDDVAEATTGADGLLTRLRPALDDVRQKLENIPVFEDVVAPFEEAHTVLEEDVRARIEELAKVVANAQTDLRKLAETAEQAAQVAVSGLRNVGERIERAAVEELRSSFEGASNGALEIVRALAQAPVTDTLRSTREWVGYYYDAGKDALELTRSGALFNDLGAGRLNGLSTQVPFDRIRDRILPDLANFDLGKLLPDFAGLKLEHLFQDVSIPGDPTGEYDWIDVRHGFDKNRLRAWSVITIDRDFGESLEVFDLSPIVLRVRRPNFTAESRLEGGQGAPVSQRTRGELSADWIVDMNGQPILTIEDARLTFDEQGKLDFRFEPLNLRLAPALQFVTDALKNFFSPMDGLSITPVAPGGIRTELSLPLPDIGTGAFTMTGITLYTHFDLLVAGGFEVGTGLWLSRPDRPFGLAVLFLGGGGWFGVDVRYRPPAVFETRVSLGISAGAFVALNFGVARGSAGLLFTVGLDFYRNWESGGSGDVVVSVGLLVWGEFSILGIASAYLRLVMRLEYRNGSMTGYGRVTVQIKICWCFTLRVNKEVRKQFAGSAATRSIDGPSVEEAVEADLENSDW